MKRPLFRFSLIIAISSCLSLSACSEAQNTEVNKREQAIEVNITSIAELNALFSKYQYSNVDKGKEKLAVPRITFSGVGKHWAVNAQKLKVKTKKRVFFQLMTPLVLIANEKIISEREIVKNSALNSTQLKKIALKYRAIKDDTVVLTEEIRHDLLIRVDVLPPSLAVAQAAKESGWGTSRFTRQGNSFFGQWDFSGKGMKPLAQRKELGNYGVARFASPLAAVDSYMLNINRNKAYQKLRQLRGQLRAEKKPITGYQLAGTLDKYSERGSAYIDGLRAIISYNKIGHLDQSYLRDNQLVHLLTDK